MTALLDIPGAPSNPGPATQDPGSPTIGAYQAEWGGIVLGEPSQVLIEESIEGIFDLTMRRGDTLVPRGDGAIQGPDYAAPRVITLPLLMVPATAGQPIFDALRTVRQAFAPNSLGEGWLRVALNDAIVYRFRGRVTRTSVPYTAQSARSTVWRFIAEITCTDPRFYGDLLKSAVIARESDGERGGFNLATDLPIDMAPSSKTSTILTNNGSVTAWPVVRFQNNSATPITQVTATNLTTAGVLDVATTIAPGQTLVVDMDRYVRAQQGPYISIDNADRFSDWTPPRDPWGLDPGGNEITFEHDGGPTDDVTALIEWRDTSL